MDPSQYRALRTGAGLADRSDRGLIEVRGADRASFLQGLLTNDVEALADGESCYAAYLTPQGRMIADLDVLHIGDALLLDVDGAACASLVERFDALVFAEDVHLADLTRDRTSLALHGPDAARLLAEIAAAPFDDLPLNGSRTATLVGPAARVARSDPAGASPSPSAGAAVRAVRTDPAGAIPASAAGRAGAAVRVARTDALGIPGYHLFCERSAADDIRAALTAAGAVPVSRDALETVRIESGRPRFGADMDTETIPLEAGIEDRAIDHDKGCYVGQEVIIRILHRGQGRVARRLVGLTQTSGPATPPPPGAALLHNDTPAGRITSATHSPALDRPIALAYVSRPLAAPGVEVVARDSAANRVFRVTALPFVAP